LGSVLNRIFSPHIFAVAGDAGDEARIKRALRIVALSNLILDGVSLPLMAAYYFAPRLLIRMLSSAAYEAGASDLWLLGGAAILFNLGQFQSMVGLMLKRPWVYLPAKILPAALLVWLLWIETPVSGIHGVALSLLASNAFQLALLLLANVFLWRRHLRAMR
jgi:O-antigen/teichoic acid export membrane protein